MDVLILRYGEIALKGKNRNSFEQKLVENINACMASNNIDGVVEKIRGRIFVRTSNKSAAIHIKHVFGLVSISPAVEVPRDIGQIKKESLEQVGEGTFRVTARRANKTFPLNSMEIEQEVGGFIVEKTGKKVRLKDPDTFIGIEIHDRAYVFNETITCYGGLPLGMTGNVVAVLQDDYDVLAAWLFMKRGCVVHTAIMGDIDTSLLDRYVYGINSRSRTDRGAGVWVDAFVEETKSLAVVSGERLNSISDFAFRTPVLRPLIAFNEIMVKDLQERIA